MAQILRGGFCISERIQADPCQPPRNPHFYKEKEEQGRDIFGARGSRGLTDPLETPKTSSLSSHLPSARMHAKLLQSRVQLFVTPWTEACQVPLSMGFSRQQYWSGSPCPPPGNLPYLGMNPCLLCLLHWHEGSLPLTSPGKPDNSLNYCIWTNIFPDTTLSKP